MSQNTKLKSAQKKAIEATKDGQLILVQQDEADATTKKAERLDLGSVLDDLRLMDHNPRRRR